MTPKLIDTETLHDGFIRLLRARLRLPGGEAIGREIEHHGQAACVLPYDAQRRTAILVRQLRAPVLYAAGHDGLLEAIAGMVEDEEPAECARREAMEEAGVALERLEKVTCAWSMPGISTERMHLYLAHYCGGAAFGATRAEDEAISVVEMTLDDLALSADNGKLSDLKTLFLVQTLRLRRPELFG